MKKSLLILSMANAILLSAHAADVPRELTNCEQSLIAKVSKVKTKRNLTMGASVLLAGGASFVTYNLMGALDSSSESSDIVWGGKGGATPQSKLIFSAVSAGAVTAVIGVGAAYLDYRSYVDTSEGVLLLFKDVKNNGMGPEIEIRTAAIQQILREAETASALKKLLKKLKKYNPDTYREENVVDEIMNVSNQILKSEVVSCHNAAEISETIDKKVISNLIKKFNPGLEVEIK